MNCSEEELQALNAEISAATKVRPCKACGNKNSLGGCATRNCPWEDKITAEIIEAFEARRSA